MVQSRPVLVSSEEKEQLPILIVDKKGLIGEGLAKVLCEQFLVVIVTGATVKKHDNIIHVPYHKKLPLIPDNGYSFLFLISYGERELVDKLSVFEKKAQVSKAKIFFVTSLLLSSPRLFQLLGKPEHASVQTVIYGETFDNELREVNEINYFIQQVRTYGRVEVSKDGLGTFYPILLDDVISSLVSLALALERPKETIFLFPHHSFTQISLARMLQKLEPMVKVDFGKKKQKNRDFYLPNNGLYFFRNYQLEERLRKIDLSREKKQSKIPQRKTHIPVDDPQEKQNHLKLFFIMLFAVFVAPVILTALIVLVGYGFLTLSLKQLEQGSVASATSSAQVAQGAFQSAELLTPSLVLPHFFLSGETKHFEETMVLGNSVVDTEISLLASFEVMQHVYQNQSLDPKNDFLRSLATVKNALLTMQKLEAENTLPQPIMDRLNKFSGTLSLVEGTIDAWPDLLGFGKKKNYLLLFQNNMEIRPGGGFIGSYGIVPLQNGQMDKLQIHNVYDADGQLTEHVEPPYGLRRYLGASNWFLRDSNFDPDFVRDGAQAQDFLQKETGQKVDGTIAIDTTFLKDLIGVVGSVNVPEYHTVVTADNFYLMTQTQAEKNSFPGSTQKQDFLRSLSNALMQKVLTDKQLSYEKLAQMITNEVGEKHLLFSFSDQSIQNVFAVNGLSSSLKDDRTSQKNTAFDFGGVVDANVGTNKANYYVKRTLRQYVTIDDRGGLQATMAATYNNTSTKTSVYGGDYKDYVQFLIPESANVASIAIDGKDVSMTPAITDPAIFTSEGFTPPPGLEVSQTEELGKKVVGFFFIVPTLETKTVSISYTTDNAIDTRQSVFTYDLRAFKQPGTDGDPYQLLIAYPNTFSVVTHDGRLSDVGGKLIDSTTLSEDMDMSATFSKK